MYQTFENLDDLADMIEDAAAEAALLASEDISIGQVEFCAGDDLTVQKAHDLANAISNLYNEDDTVLVDVRYQEGRYHVVVRVGIDVDTWDEIQRMRDDMPLYHRVRPLDSSNDPMTQKMKGFMDIINNMDLRDFPLPPELDNLLGDDYSYPEEDEEDA